MNTTGSSTHPYYPIGIALSGNTFVANDWDVVSLISAFAAGWAVILGTASVVVKRINPTLKKSDQALVWWFILSKYSSRGVGSTINCCSWVNSCILRRILHAQSYTDGGHAGFLWSAMEGICLIGF
jgi:hypothetical protein